MFSRKNKDNKGMAMVSVMIVVTLLAIMAGTVLQMSYLAYNRKVVERRSNETFYTAESCIDTMKAAVQNRVATQLIKAKEGSDKFLDAAFDSLQPASLGMDLRTFLYNQIVYVDGDPTKALRNDANFFNGYKTAGDFTTIKDGIDPSNGGSFSIGSVVNDKANKKLIIKDVKITFVNKMGYVAEISTDIVVNAPVYASDISVPVASYSMFAGSGASVKCLTNYNKNQAHMGIYLHQEGNVYFGLGTFNDHSQLAALYLDPPSSSQGGIYFSVGGENAVFNGDVYVDNGSTLIFTGGDGKGDAYIQVNGYVYLRDGASLLMAKNVHLVCRGIFVDDDGDTDKNDWVAYTGTAGNANGSLSQFYPVKESYVIDNAATQYNKYINFTSGVKTTEDVASVINKVNQGNLPSGDALDPRAAEIGSGSNTQASGVYVLDCAKDSTVGWKHNANDKYYLVTKEGNAYKVTGKTGVYNQNVYTNAADVKLITDPLVTYNDIEVDPEFARIVNMPMIDLMNFDTNQYLGNNFTVYKDYNTSNSSSYSTVKFSALSASLAADNLTKIKNAINWDNIDAGLMDTNETVNIDMKDRKFRIPSKISVDSSISKDNIKVTLTDGTTYGAGQLAVGISQGGNCVVNANSDTSGYYIGVSESEIELHVGSKPYAGMFLSAKNVYMGESTGVCRGISLLELAKLTANPGLSEDNKDNPVRKILETLSGAAMVNPQNNKYGTDQNTKNMFIGCIIFDNLFNGGVESFWQENRKDIGGNGGSNENLDLIDTDNWQKN